MPANHNTTPMAITGILAEEAGKPGSTIKREIDLCERGLAWRHDVKDCAAFGDCIKEIKSLL